MNIEYLKRISIGATISSLISIAPANAEILVEPIINFADPNLPNQSFGFGIGRNPPNTLVSWNAPDVSGEQNFLNDTGLDITNITLLLFPQEDFLDEEVIWADVDGDGEIGRSNFFSNFVVDNDFTFPGRGNTPLIDITGGVIPNGELFIQQLLTEPDLTVSSGDPGPLLVGGAYDGIKVPEPSSILGLMLIVGLGSVFVQNKK